MTKEKEIVREHYRKLGQKRWANVSEEERKKHMSELGKKGAAKRWAKKTKK